MNDAEGEGRLQGVKVCEAAPSINHLLFADDSLLLLKINQESADHLQNVLQLYEDCLGQTINKEKSSVLFSKNYGDTARLDFLTTLGVSHGARNDKYLGLPVYMGRSRTKMFSCLKDRVWKHIQGWKEKLLSKAGKETLIKAVAQAIPSFAMSYFDLTEGLCDELSMMICRGLSRMMRRKCIGCPGKRPLEGRRREAWAIETYISSIWQCSAGKLGASSRHQTPSVHAH